MGNGRSFKVSAERVDRSGASSRATRRLAVGIPVIFSAGLLALAACSPDFQGVFGEAGAESTTASSGGAAGAGGTSGSGQNVLAIEVHQAVSNSSDLGIDARVTLNLN